MAVERTLSIIKPDAVEKNHIGAVLALIEAAGLEIKAMRMVHLSRPQAEGFYAVHRERPFFGELVEFMTRGPVVISCLEGEGAIAKYRGVMGATDPAKAEDGTIRKLYGSNIGENACHGSDAPETAAFEVGYFFPGYELG
ncbi:MAG: nucleoside-diphosphate kinase [Myxococcales bacterium]|nr:nucleoside-diphosphate kinase [Myxococcales bacterium]